MSETTRTCPRCAGTALRHVEDGELVLDTCPSCRGLWIDHDEWKPLVGSVRSIRRPDALELDFRRPPCPACEAGDAAAPGLAAPGLVPRGLAGVDDLEIDICARCGGAWLDAGELEKAREQARRARAAARADRATRRVEPPSAKQDAAFAESEAEALSFVEALRQTWARLWQRR